MKKSFWKCYEVDDYTTVCARSPKDAIEWAKKEQIIDDEYFYNPPIRVDMKSQHMIYSIPEIPFKRHKPKATETSEGEPSIVISLKRAVRYYVRNHRPKEPFIICTCGL